MRSVILGQEADQVAGPILVQRVGPVGVRDADDHPGVVEAGPGHGAARPAEREEVVDDAVTPDHGVPVSVGPVGPAGDEAGGIDRHATALGAAERGGDFDDVVRRGRERGGAGLGAERPVGLGLRAAATDRGEEEGGWKDSHGSLRRAGGSGHAGRRASMCFHPYPPATPLLAASGLPIPCRRSRRIRTSNPARANPEATRSFGRPSRPGKAARACADRSAGRPRPP